MTEGGADCVISKFSLDQVLRKPTALLDALTLYLFIVHNIDWYSSNWARTSNLTTEEKSEVKVFEEKDKDHDEQVSKVIKAPDPLAPFFDAQTRWAEVFFALVCASKIWVQELQRLSNSRDFFYSK